MKKWAPVIVVWADAVTYHEPAHSVNDDFPPVIRRSIGHFIRRTPDAITIAMEDDRATKMESDVQTVTSIPFGMVRDIIELQPKPKRKTP